MKKQLWLLMLLVASLSAQSQILNPVKWSYSSKSISADEAELILTAKMEDGWHLYSQFIDEGGPVPTSFTFEASPDYQLVGKVEERSKVIKAYDENFMMDILYFSHEAVFAQKIKLLKTKAVVTGSLEFMVCDDQQCLPPETIEFSIEAKGAAPKTAKQDAKPVETVKEAPKAEVEEKPVAVKVEAVSTTKAVEPVKNEVEATAQNQEQEDVKSESLAAKNIETVSATENQPVKESRSLWAIFVAGVLGGIAAFFMPCIFPMLPFTISYFTKSKSKQSAVMQASLYGFFIVVIYVTLGLLITVLFGADALNILATNGIFNFFFFVLLVVFAFSFFGAFEIVLPSSWVNKADQQSDKGGLLGLFFMAATLSIVSFSCTGPIIGTLLVEAATMGQLMGPAVGMLGFALALAVPFTLFSMFPSWLKSMPKSGGWLNSVKVVLGFLELALALKFLSNVDLAYHWDWFDREVYLVLWIAIFGLLSLYLIGKLKLPNDSDVKHISSFRLMLSVITISFTLYMIPGLWGAPLKAISAFLPPMQSQDFDLYTPTLGGGNTYHMVENETEHTNKKYSDIFHAPYGLNAFFDYEEGMAYAQKTGKPVMIDFTGHACVNCRKMEADVWSDKSVLDILRNDYVLIQLYVDDKTKLPEAEQTVSDFSGKKIKTIGNKWSDYQASQFNANSQPFYVLLNADGKLLAKPQGADYNVDNFASFLKRGVAANKNLVAN